jgi:hypothetical protein
MGSMASFQLMDMAVKTLVPALVALSVLAGFWLTPAKAHSWYPRECCSDHDCMHADKIGTDVSGNRIVIVGERKVWVPTGFPVRASPDGRIHICFTDDVYGSQMPRCVFMPAQS